MAGLVLYLLALIAIAIGLPPHWWDQNSAAFLFAVGAIAVWRYGWGGVHLVRGGWFRHVVFPRQRTLINKAEETAQPSRTYMLITSYRIDTSTSLRAYAAAFSAAHESGLRTTVVASIVEGGDLRLIKALYYKICSGTLVDLVFVHLSGTGKRDAIAHALRAISASRPPSDGVVCLIDGDTLVPPNALRRLLPMFAFNPGADALTTDETCEVDGNWAFRDWYNLRFAQRQVLMCSLGLSRRVLTLTGRLSLFRASVACSPDFIASIETDSVPHWRLGRIDFLTGDDKSTWFHILKSGREMLYVPDVRVVTIETPPSPHFLEASAMLMARWFGNMLRTNGRALALGPQKIGLFVWVSVLDQRLSMWTGMIGPIAALYLALAYTPAALIAYAFWVALTRFIQTLSLMTVRKEASWTWPFFLFFNQIFGSSMKIWILFRQNRQKWTRQGTSRSNRQTSMIAATSVAMHFAALAALFAGVGVMLGILKLSIGPERILELL